MPLIQALGRGGATASVLASSTSSLARTRSAPDSDSHRNWHRTVHRFVISCHCRAALIAPGFGANRPVALAVQASYRKLWHTRLRRAVLGSTVAVSAVSATHCLTTHSSRRCFAMRLNSSVRPHMSYFAYDRTGGTVTSPDEAAMSLLLNSLAAPDTEHPDVSLSHESGWCASVFGSGLIIFENVETGEGPWHMRLPAPQQALDVWRLLSGGQIAAIQSHPWVPGYGA